VKPTAMAIFIGLYPLLYRKLVAENRRAAVCPMAPQRKYHNCKTGSDGKASPRCNLRWQANSVIPI
jgi:hypothetical protein